METLLIVDDDPSIREIFTLILSESGYTVFSSDGGKDCLDKLTQISPDLIILDIMMHPVDGWETLISIRETQKTRSIPVIMWSGKSPLQGEILRYGGWIDDYFMKPIGMQTITDALRAEFVRLKQIGDEREALLTHGADARDIDEYFHLRRLLSLQEKFFRTCAKNSEDIMQFFAGQKARLSELQQLLPAHPEPLQSDGG
jgi:DNA-binding response OmpR family regulator